MIQSSSGIASQSDAVLPWYAMPNIGRHPLAWHAAARSGKETVRANTILPGTEPGDSAASRTWPCPWRYPRPARMSESVDSASAPVEGCS